MFIGKSLLRLSETRQITLPPNFSAGMSDPIYLTQGFDRNLLLLPQETFKTLFSHLKETSISDPLARLMSRLFFGAAVEIVMDRSAHIEIPLVLSNYAGIREEILVIGMGNFLEIWSPEFWSKEEENLNDFQSNAHRFDKFDISFS